jgi:hypothetical protein
MKARKDTLVTKHLKYTGLRQYIVIVITHVLVDLIPGSNTRLLLEVLVHAMSVL